MDFLYFLLIGLCAGWLAGRIMASPMGLVGDLIVGVIGAFIGGGIFRVLQIAAMGGLGQLIAATVGACVLIFLLRLFRR